jgi:hypothetical protein
MVPVLRNCGFENSRGGEPDAEITIICDSYRDSSVSLVIVGLS